MDRQEILEGAREIFFKAMLDGYIGDGINTKKGVTPGGYKTLTFPKKGTINGFRVVDRYCTNPNSDKSCGTTTIFFEGKPVWWMSYSGEYFQKVIPFLKQALCQKYEKHQFFGGRGPSEYSDGTYNYSNLAREITFVDFCGTERIRRKNDGSIMGHHYYRGMALI